MTASSTRIGADFVTWISRHWGLGEVVEYGLIKAGVDTTLLISTESSNFYARIWGSSRYPVATICKMLDAAQYLWCPAVESLPSLEGRFLRRYSETKAVSVTKDGGARLAWPPPLGLGEMLELRAQMVPTRVTSCRELVWDLARFERVYRFTARLDERQMGTLEREVMPLLAHEEAAVIHGDMALANAVAAGGQLKFVDFGHVGLGPRWLDLGFWVASTSIPVSAVNSWADIRTLARSTLGPLLISADELRAAYLLRIARGIAMMASYEQITAEGRAYLDRIRFLFKVASRG